MKLASIEKIKKAVKKHGLSLDSISCIKVWLEKDNGWHKEDFWGLDKYKDYLKNPSFYDGRVCRVEIQIITDNIDKIGNTYKV